MNTSRCEGWDSVSEFKILDDCYINFTINLSLKLISIIFAGVLFISELLLIIIKYGSIQNKGTLPKLLIVWALLENVVMSVRPIIELILPIRSSNSIIMEYITHISAASVAGLAVTFAYMETKLFHQASMVNYTYWWIVHKKSIFITAGISQALLFVLGPVLVYFKLINELQAFWTPVIIVDFTVIPYVCITGIIIYNKIKHMIGGRNKKLATHILITIIACSTLGIFTGTVGIVAWRGEFPIEWIFIELCWISAIMFSGFIFIVLSRRQKKKKGLSSTGASSDIAGKIGSETSTI